MPQNYYCPKCGQRNLYEGIKPKLCGYCGVNFAQASHIAPVVAPKVNPLTVVQPPRPRHVEEYDEEYNDAPFNPRAMDGFDIELNVENPSPGISMKDLAYAEGGEKNFNSKKIAPKIKGKAHIIKKLPEEFVREAKMNGYGKNSNTDPGLGGDPDSD